MKKVIIAIMLMWFIYLCGEIVITSDEAINAALQNNDDLASAEYDLKISDWEKLSVLSSFIPQASFSMSTLKIDPAPVSYDMMGNTIELEDSQSTNTLQVVCPIFTGGKRLLALKIAEKAKNIASNQLDQTSISVRSNAEIKYLSLVESCGLLKIAKADLGRKQVSQQIALVRYTKGLLSEAEYLQIQTETATAEAMLIDAEMYYNAASIDLANYCNLKTGLVPADSIYTEINYGQNNWNFTGLEEKLVTECLIRNLDLGSIRQSVEISRLNKWMSLSDNLPALNLIFEKSWEDDFDIGSKKDKSSSIMLSASVPLLPFADTYSNYKAEEYRYRKAERELQSAEKGIGLQLRNVLLSIGSLEKKLKASTLAMDYAAKTYEQMEERYKNDLISTTDLLSIALMQQNSEITVLRDKINLINSESELRMLMNVQSNLELTNLIEKMREGK